MRIEATLVAALAPSAPANDGESVEPGFEEALVAVEQAPTLELAEPTNREEASLVPLMSGGVALDFALLAQIAPSSAAWIATPPREAAPTPVAPLTPPVRVNEAMTAPDLTTPQILLAPPALHAPLTAVPASPPSALVSATPAAPELSPSQPALPPTAPSPGSISGPAPLLNAVSTPLHLTSKDSPFPGVTELSAPPPDIGVADSGRPQVTALSEAVRSPVDASPDERSTVELTAPDFTTAPGVIARADAARPNVAPSEAVLMEGEALQRLNPVSIGLPAPDPYPHALNSTILPPLPSGLTMPSAANAELNLPEAPQEESTNLNRSPVAVEVLADEVADLLPAEDGLQPAVLASEAKGGTGLNATVAPTHPEVQALNSAASTKPAPQTDVGTPITEPTRQHVIQQALDKLDQLAASRPLQHFVIHLEPAELGAITIHYRGSGIRSEADIIATDHRVLQALESARPQLVQAIESKGLQFDGLNLQLGNSTPDAQQQRAQAQAAAREDFLRNFNLAHANQDLSRSELRRISPGGLDLLT